MLSPDWVVAWVGDGKAVFVQQAESPTVAGPPGRKSPQTYPDAAVCFEGGLAGGSPALAQRRVCPAWPIIRCSGSVYWLENIII